MNNDKLMDEFVAEIIAHGDADLLFKYPTETEIEEMAREMGF